MIHTQSLVLPVFVFLSVSPLFAQGVLFPLQLLPGGMSSLMTEIMEIFIGPFVQGILIVCLCGCAIAYGFNKDNEKMKRNIIAIAVAIAILVAASKIVEAVWAAASSG